jgi:hypothetical protein
MSKKMITCCVAILMGFASVAPAAERMGVPNDTLASMGLGGMQQISDQDGMNVRGKGIALAAGFGIARFLGNISANAHASASGPKHNAAALGLNGSFAGGALLPGGGFLGGVAFGGSAAFAR